MLPALKDIFNKSLCIECAVCIMLGCINTIELKIINYSENDIIITLVNCFRICAPITTYQLFYENYVRLRCVRFADRSVLGLLVCTVSSSIIFT